MHSIGEQREKAEDRKLSNGDGELNDDMGEKTEVETKSTFDFEWREDSHRKKPAKEPNETSRIFFSGIGGMYE